MIRLTEEQKEKLRIGWKLSIVKKKEERPKYNYGRPYREDGLLLRLNGHRDKRIKFEVRRREDKISIYKMIAPEYIVIDEIYFRAIETINDEHEAKIEAYKIAAEEASKH